MISFDVLLAMMKLQRGKKEHKNACSCVLLQLLKFVGVIH